MELLSPAGNLDKLEAAYRYGADAVYIGLRSFSLRSKADNFGPDAAHRIARARIGDDGSRKKLYGAINVFFHEGQLGRLADQVEDIRRFGFDALIVSDLGAAAVLRRLLPDMEMHLSTQANCTNSEAVRAYRDLGFSRIILAREVSLREVEAIRRSVPDVELEVFVHGAMCLAYSGRCLLSAWMADRSGNSGHCAHSCRWKYRLGELVLEEEERPGEFYPIEEEGGFTTILSSRDLCMIDHIDRLMAAGADAAKIEGRMKSVYYTALVTRAYRKAIDRALGKPVEDFDAYREDLFRVSRRDYTTGFYFGREDIERHAEADYRRSHLFLGTLLDEVDVHSRVSGSPDLPPGYRLYSVDIRNPIRLGDRIEFIGPAIPSVSDSAFLLFDPDGNPTDRADHGRPATLATAAPVDSGFLIRKEIDDPSRDQS